MSSLNAERNPVDVLAEEFAGRLRRGERPSLGEYTEKYPQHAEQIRKVFPALVMMEQLKPVAGDLTGDLGSAPPEEPVAQECLGDYRIVREVGRGAMGVVYEAEQLSLGRRVALKVLASVALRSATAIERFQREAMAAARLHHTNIVPVFGVGESDGVRFYVMQFIRGEGVDKVLADVRRLRKLSAGTVDGEASVAHSLVRGRFTADATLSTEKPGARSCLAASATVAELQSPVPLSSSALSEGSQDDYYRAIARIGVQAADALAYAHRQHIVHRDIKPSNLLLDLQGTLWITDFGLAKAEGSGDLTQSGDIVGTLRYMAPERFDGRTLPQSDIYALGVTLYEMLTLQPAFDASEKAALIARVYQEQPTPPRKIDPAIPRDLETVVQKCLAKEPEHRYKTAEALAEDLRRFLADRPILARQTSVREQAWRWCRRNPALASLVAAVAFLVSLVAVISTIASLQLQWQLRQVEIAEQKEKDANRLALAKLWDSYLSQARANRMTGRPGQRFATLRAIQEAMKLPLPEGRSLDELRTEATAALCLPDLEVEREWNLGVTGLTAFAIADSFERYAYADKDGNVSIRRLNDHAELCPRLPGEGPLAGYDTLRFSPDGRFLVQHCQSAAGWRIRLWKLDGGEPVVTLTATSERCVWEFSADSRQVAVPHGKDREVWIHDTETGRELRRFRFQDGPGQQLRWNPRRPLLAAHTSTGWQTIDVETGKIVAQATVPGGCDFLAWHPEGRLLACASYADGTYMITIWDTQTEQLATPPLKGFTSGGIVFRFNHAGDLLLSNDWNQIWRLWDVRTGRQLLTQPGISTYFSFRSDDGLFGPDVDEAGTVRLFRLRRGNEFVTLLHRRSPGTGTYGACAVLDAEGRLLAVDTNEGVALVDVLRGEEVQLLRRAGSRPLRFEARGEALWTYGPDGVLRWPIQIDPTDRNKRRVATEQRVASTTSTEAVFGSTPDMNIIAIPIPYENRGAVLWQRAANRKLPLGPQYDVRCCAVSSDGRWVATGSHWFREGSGVKIWDAQNGEHVADLPIASGLCAARFSPDSKWLLTSGGGARIWRTGTWQEGPALGGPSSFGNFGSFTPEADLLALEDVPSVVRLVRTATGKEVARLTAPEQTRLGQVCFTPDGSRLITWGEERRALHIFDLHAIRRGLREIGLDWSDEPLPAPSNAAAKAEPLDIRVVLP
jgi:serine/threonine protein kinase/WD40 repeat protein